MSASTSRKSWRLGAKTTPLLSTRGYQGLNCDRPGRHGTFKGRPSAAEGGRHGVEHDPEEVVAAASDLLAKNKALKKQLKAATKALMAQQAAQVLASGQQVNKVHIESAGDISVLAPLVLKGAGEETLLWAKLNGRLYFALISPAGQARTYLTKLQALGEVQGGSSPKVVTGNTTLPLERVAETIN